MKPHKHAELIKAWADGADIQCFDFYSRTWSDCTQDMTWDEQFEYRIKPEPQPDTGKTWLYVYNNAEQGKTWLSPVPYNYANSTTCMYMGKIEVLK